MTANDPTRGQIRPADDADEVEDRVVPGDGATEGPGNHTHVHEDSAAAGFGEHAHIDDGHGHNDHAPAADEDAGDPTGFDAPIRRRDPLTRGALAIIRGYKLAVSPLMPPSCRFVPTCSEYGYEAVAKYGIITGGRLAIWRILRCNPFGRGGYDPVP